MQSRPRIRGREPPPPPPPSGGRYRRRSPPPPSPRHHRRVRDQPPPLPQQQRRSPELLRRQEEKPQPQIVGDRRSRADILLEAGRLAAHYLVSKGVIPEHLLHARENPEHKNPANRPEHLLHARENPEHRNPANRPEPPAAGYTRKRDDMYHEDDTRWRRNGGGVDWGRHKGGDDKLSRRSGWDRRSQSFDGRRKYNDVGGAGDDDRSGRRNHAYDDQRRSVMSRSYSHNDRRATNDDRRPSDDARLDRRRRSRSRSRTRTRSYCGGSQRDSDRRPGSGDLDQSKVSESRNVPGGNCHVDYDDAGQAARDLKAPSPAVVMEGGDGAIHEDALMESKDQDQDICEDEDGEATDDGLTDGGAYEMNTSQHQLWNVYIVGDGASHEDALMESKDQDQDICEDEDGEATDDGLTDGGAYEMNASQHQLWNVDIVHPSETVEEPVHIQPLLSDVEGNRESDIARLIDPAAMYNGCSENLRDELEAPQPELVTDVGDLTRDEQELPAWYGIFDLNVAETHDSSEMSEIPVSPRADSVCDYVPDLVGQQSQRPYYGTSETQGQDECADDKQQLVDGQGLLNQGIGTYDLNKNNMDDEKMLLNQGADEHKQDNHQLEDEQILLNNEEMLLKQDAGAQDHNHQMENDQKLLKQGSAVQSLDNYHLHGEQLLLSHAANEHSDDNHQKKNEQILSHQASMHDLDNYDLNSEHVLLNNDANKPDTYEGQSKDAQMLLEHAADRQSHSLGIGQMIPVINLEDDYEEQSGTKELFEPKSDALRTDNALPEHRNYQDQQDSSLPDHHRTNIIAASPLVTPNFGNRWTGRGNVNAQGIPGDEDVLFGTFDRIPLEVINVWDVPSSELGKSL